MSSKSSRSTGSAVLDERKHQTQAFLQPFSCVVLAALVDVSSLTRCVALACQGPTSPYRRLVWSAAHRGLCCSTVRRVHDRMGSEEAGLQGMRPGRGCEWTTMLMELYDTGLPDCVASQTLKPILHSLLIPGTLTFLSVPSNGRLKAPAFRLIGADVTKVRSALVARRCSTLTRAYRLEVCNSWTLHKIH